MNTKNFLKKILWVGGLIVILLISTPVVAGESKGKAKGKDKQEEKDKDKDKDKAKAEEEARKAQEEARKKYADAQKFLKNGDTKKAIDALNEAIKRDPQPANQYYPYLLLGQIYLTQGNLANAQKYCAQEKAKGVAPSAAINDCLTLVVTLTQKAAAPTPAPQVPVTSVSPPAPQMPTTPPQSPPSQTDLPPAIAITSMIPAETTAAMLTVTGAATDDYGIQDVIIQVRKPGTRDLIAVPKPQRAQEQFEATVPLEIGVNEIVILAFDTAGQKSERIAAITRLPPPVAPEARAVSTPQPEEGTPEEPAQRGEVYAVIIGISKFQDQRIPPLRFTVNDAKAFAEVLTDPNYGGVPADHVQLLLDEDATDRNIKTAIGKWLSGQAKPEDTVIIYYSGHGAPEGEEKYWVTYNADVDNLYATALSNNEIFDMLSRVESKRMITFLDSCYSAATVNRKDRTRAVQTEIPWEKFAGEGNVTISASDGKQLSLELESYGHGVFTYYLLEGLKGRADGAAGSERDGMVEVDELWNYVKNTVSDTARKRGNKQTPVFQGALTAGIPLTYDLAYLQELERKRAQEKQQKQTQLQALFDQQKVSAAHFECAFKMLDAGKSNNYIDGLLAGTISPETFGKVFSCESVE